MATTIVEDNCSHNDGNDDKDDHGSAPDFEAAARDIQNRELARRRQALVAPRQERPPPREEPSKASALDALLSQGLPEAEPRVLGRRRVLRRG